YTSTFGAGNNVRLSSSASGGSTAATLNLFVTGSPVTLTLPGALTLSQGGILKSGANGANITGGSITASTLTVVNSGGNLTLDSALAGTMPLIKSGGGTLVLSSTANNFTGSVYLNTGSLQIASDSRLGNSANGITFNGGTLATTAAFSLGSSRVMTFNANGGGIDVA